MVCWTKSDQWKCSFLLVSPGDWWVVWLACRWTASRPSASRRRSSGSARMSSWWGLPSWWSRSTRTSRRDSSSWSARTRRTSRCRSEEPHLSYGDDDDEEEEDDDDNNNNYNYKAHWSHHKKKQFKGRNYIQHRKQHCTYTKLHLYRQSHAPRTNTHACTHTHTTFLDYTCAHNNYLSDKTSKKKMPLYYWAEVLCLTLKGTRSFFFLPGCRPDMTFAVDWALNNNFIYLSLRDCTCSAAHIELCKKWSINFLFFLLQEATAAFATFTSWIAFSNTTLCHPTESNSWS